MNSIWIDLGKVGHDNEGPNESELRHVLNGWGNTRSVQLPRMLHDLTHENAVGTIARPLRDPKQASDKGFHGLLGSPFLQKYGAIIDYEQKIISLNCQNKSQANKTNAPDKK